MQQNPEAELDAWEGELTCGDLEMIVIAYYYLPHSQFYGEWYGEGITLTAWPLEKFELETEIGTIVVVSRTVGQLGTRFQFFGKGEPKGPLAAAMGIPR